MSTVNSERILFIMQAFGKRYGLSDRETQVLVYFAEGCCRKEAAHALGCSAATINTYWRRILAKVRVDSPERLLANLIVFLTGEASSIRPDVRSPWRNTAPTPRDFAASQSCLASGKMILKGSFRPPGHARTLITLQNLVRALGGVVPTSGPIG
jgi:DNA-binding CsgD family transcriptional regulator